MNMHDTGWENSRYDDKVWPERTSGAGRASGSGGWPTMKLFDSIGSGGARREYDHHIVDNSDGYGYGFGYGTYDGAGNVKGRGSGR